MNLTLWEVRRPPDGHDDVFFCQLVWASSDEEAKSLASPAYLYHQKEFEDEPEDATVLVARSLPAFVPTPGMRAGLEDDRAVQRRAGWRYEGDRYCTGCGLWACDDTVPTCGNCDFCEECKTPPVTPERACPDCGGDFDA